MKKIFIFTFAFFIIPLNVYGYNSTYMWSPSFPLSIDTSTDILSTANYDTTTTNPLELDCGSCLLIEQSTRKNIIFI